MEDKFLDGMVDASITMMKRLSEGGTLTPDELKFILLTKQMSMDGLKDGEMMLDYAKCAKDEGHSDVANYFFMRAKTRVQMMNEDHQKMEELIKKEEMESGKSYEEGKWDCMHEYFMEEKEELEYAVQNFKM